MSTSRIYLPLVYPFNVDSSTSTTDRGWFMWWIWWHFGVLAQFMIFKVNSRPLLSISCLYSYLRDRLCILNSVYFIRWPYVMKPYFWIKSYGFYFMFCFNYISYFDWLCSWSLAWMYVTIICVFFISWEDWLTYQGCALICVIMTWFWVMTLPNINVLHLF